MIQYSQYLSQWLAVNLSYDREWFETKEAAEAFALSGWQEQYRGFILTRDGRIWQHDREVFGFITTRSYSVAEAKDRIDLSILAREIAASHPDPVGFARGLNFDDTEHLVEDFAASDLYNELKTQP